MFPPVAKRRISQNGKAWYHYSNIQFKSTAKSNPEVLLKNNTTVNSNENLELALSHTQSSDVDEAAADTDNDQSLTKTFIDPKDVSIANCINLFGSSVFLDDYFEKVFTVNSSSGFGYNLSNFS